MSAQLRRAWTAEQVYIGSRDQDQAVREPGIETVELEIKKKTETELFETENETDRDWWCQPFNSKNNCKVNKKNNK